MDIFRWEIIISRFNNNIHTHVISTFPGNYNSGISNYGSTNTLTSLAVRVHIRKYNVSMHVSTKCIQGHHITQTYVAFYRGMGYTYSFMLLF